MTQGGPLAGPRPPGQVRERFPRLKSSNLGPPTGRQSTVFGMVSGVLGGGEGGVQGALGPAGVNWVGLMGGF